MEGFLFRKSTNSDVVLLRQARSAAAINNERLPQGLHCRDTIGIFGCQIIRFTKILFQIIQLNWKASRPTLAPSARTRPGNIFPMRFMDGRKSIHSSADRMRSDLKFGSLKQWPQAETVFCGIHRDFRFEDIREGCQQVGLVD